ncbi:MAG: hypothetical protein ACRYFY_09045 [Janthinobacterium lividum]
MGVTGFTLILLPLCLVLFTNMGRLLQLMLVFGVFEAAAALTFGGIGLQPALMPGLAFIAYFALQLLLGARFSGQGPVISMTKPFVLVTVYALVSSILMPWIFQDKVFVWPQKAQPPFVLMPLEPSSSNINQDIYLFINCVILVAAAIFMVRSPLRLKTLFQTYLASGFVVAFIAIWQFASKLAHVPYPESLFYSNPGWAILTGQQMGSIPRINGPFSEPSSLGGYMGTIVCATGWQLLQGHRDRVLKWLFFTGLLTMMLSTSSTGFGVLGIVCIGVAALGLLTGSARIMGAILKLGLPLGLLILLLLGIGNTFAPELSKNVGTIFGQTLTKQQSSSYEDRTSTDIDSLMVVVDTFGLGAGWGSNRSSSLLPGLLAGVGIPGVVGLAWFAIVVGKGVRRVKAARCAMDQLFVVDGCCGALIGFLVAALLSGPTINSVTFFCLVAILIACIVQVDMQQAAQSGLRRKRVLAHSHWRQFTEFHSGQMQPKGALHESQTTMEKIEPI